jgi:hypothetical protein
VCRSKPFSDGIRLVSLILPQFDRVVECGKCL